MNRVKWVSTFFLFVIIFLPPTVQSADISIPGMSVNFQGANQQASVANAFKILLGLTVLSLAPAILMVMTSFIRIIIVLAILRHALGMQQTPPNTILVSLALFLTVFSMAPIFKEINQQAFQPFMAGSLATERAIESALSPLRQFMVKQTREQDLMLMLDIAKEDTPRTIEDISTTTLIPAFMLSELKTAFQIGFVIFLPFLLVDIVVAGILMSMGMMMVPPMMISLPIKIMLFVLIDGWTTLVHSLIGSFN